MSTWSVPDEALTELGERAMAASDGAVSGYHVAFGEVALSVSAERSVEVMSLLRDDPAL